MHLNINHPLQFWLLLFFTFSILLYSATSQVQIQDTLAAEVDTSTQSSGIDVISVENDTIDSDSVDVRNNDTLSLETPVFRSIENHAFQVGEHLVFEITYGPIKAGKATMSVPGIDTLYGRPAYRILTTARSNNFFDGFYKVRDWVESIMDAEGLFSWKYQKHLSEGDYKRDRYATFDQNNRYILDHKKSRNDTIQAPLYVMDVLASFYYTRIQDLIIGQSFDVDNFEDGKIYPLKILVHRKEKVKVPAGEFKCIVVEPVLREEGLFKASGKLTIWLTDDERKMPVLMKSKVIVGSIATKLISYRSH